MICLMGEIVNDLTPITLVKTKSTWRALDNSSTLQAYVGACPLLTSTLHLLPIVF